MMHIIIFESSLLNEHELLADEMLSQSTISVLTLDGEMIKKKEVSISTRADHD